MKNSTYISPGTTQKIIFSLIPIFLFFIFGELVLRILGFTYYSDWLYNDPVWGKDPYMIYRMRPGCVTKDDFVRINSYGFRGEEFSVEKNKNITRIICMGDSCTFGFQIKWTSYPNELQKLLNNSAKSKQYEVINAGIPDYSSYQGRRLLERKVLKLNPDIITISYGWNDLRLTKQKPDKEQETNPYWFFIDKAVNKSRIYQLLNKTLTPLKVKMKRDKKAGRKQICRVSLKDYENNIKSIIALARAYGVKVFLLTQPAGEIEGPKNEFLQKYLMRHRSYSAVICSIARQLQVPLIDLERAFEAKKGERFFDDPKKDLIHPNLEGQKVIAEEIYKTISNISERE